MEIAAAQNVHSFWAAFVNINIKVSPKVMFIRGRHLHLIMHQSFDPTLNHQQINYIYRRKIKVIESISSIFRVRRRPFNDKIRIYAEYFNFLRRPLMRTHPNRIYLYFVITIILSLSVNFSCSKDSETLKDAILLDPSKTIQNSSEQDSISNTETIIDEPIIEEVLIKEDTVAVIFETRTTSFSPIYDAHIQNGEGFNETIVRLEEDKRTSYLMFDLAPIDSIGGKILSAELSFTINSDDGDGEIIVYKGSSNNWTEDNLSEDTAPDLDIELGTLNTEYRVNKSQTINLMAEELPTQLSSLILLHKNGNDLAFASKEHPEANGPQLSITYETPKDSQEIILDSSNVKEFQDTNETPIVKENNQENLEESNNESDQKADEGSDTSNSAQNNTKEELIKEETEEPKEPLQNSPEPEETETNEPSQNPNTLDEETEVAEDVSEEEEEEEETTEPVEEAQQDEEPSTPAPPTNDLNEKPTARAKASPSNGPAPLKVVFNASDSSDDKQITNYSWDFKDGNKSTQNNPTHTFSDSGTYKVLLTVKDEEGLSSSEEVIITVENKKNTAPVAKITASPISGEVPLKVEFKGNGSTDDDAVTSYSWNFKDGSTSTKANDSHTFSKAGNYEVELTVKDEEGLTDKATLIIKVLEVNNEPPSAIVSATPTTGTVPLKVQFKGSSSKDDKAITSYQWDFKDGTQSTEENPNHTFTLPNTYSVELTVKDKEGLTSSKTIEITANPAQNKPPVAKITADLTSGFAPLRVKFTGEQSTDDNGISNYLWRFNDGQQDASNESPEHTFEQPGIYTVELTVKDNEGLSHTTSVNITVNQQDKGNAPEGSYFVTPSGSASNDGLSEATAWSLEYAGQNAKAGDYVYIKAGNYGNVTLKPGSSGTPGNPIRFIGYKDKPGDVQANSGSTFSYGNNLDPNKMPLLKGSRVNKIGQGTGIYNFHNYIEFSNIQITEYGEGVFSSGDYTSFDNIIVTQIGDFNPAHTYPDNTSNQSLNYKGIGIKVSGDFAVIKNCFVLNAGAEGYRFSECRNQKHSNNKVYSDSTINPCDYYYLLGIGAENNDVSNIYVERVGDLQHSGHGLVLKFSAKNNNIRNSTVKNTWLELSYSNVTGNNFSNCTVVGGANNNGALLIANGANNNTFNQCRVTRCDGISFSDWDEDFSRGDVRNAGHHNTFKQCTFDNNLAGINFFWYSQNNKENKANDNTFDGCTFRDMEQLFLVDRANTNTLIKNSTITNIGKLRDSFYPTVNSGITLNANYQNNKLQNCGFSLD